MVTIRTATRSTVIHKARQELWNQRRSLLEEANINYKELREHAENYPLCMCELDLWHTVESLDYLLAGIH